MKSGAAASTVAAVSANEKSDFHRHPLLHRPRSRRRAARSSDLQERTSKNKGHKLFERTCGPVCELAVPQSGVVPDACLPPVAHHLAALHAELHDELTAIVLQVIVVDAE